MYSYAFSVVVGLYYHVPNANLQKIFEIYVPIYSFLRQKTPKTASICELWKHFRGLEVVCPVYSTRI